LSAITVLGDLVFNGDGYISYTINVPGQVLEFDGGGITNNSGYTQNFVCNGSGVIEFFNSASAGDQTKFTGNNGQIYFFDSSNAGSATITNGPGTSNLANCQVRARVRLPPKPVALRNSIIARLRPAQV